MNAGKAKVLKKYNVYLSLEHASELEQYGALNISSENEHFQLNGRESCFRVTALTREARSSLAVWSWELVRKVISRTVENTKGVFPFIVWQGHGNDHHTLVQKFVGDMQ